MNRWLYVMMIERGKTFNRVTKAVIERHVAHIKKLDDDGKLHLCGAFKGYPGVAGMVILKTESFDEADALCKQEPLVVEGYATYKLRNMQIADKQNNYLLG